MAVDALPPAVTLVPDDTANAAGEEGDKPTDPATAASLSVRSLDATTDGEDDDDADFDPDADKSEDDDADDIEDDDGEDPTATSSDDDEAARAAKASFLRSFGERAPEDANDAVVADDDFGNLPLADAEMEQLFDSEMSDTDDDFDDSDDDDEDVSLVPEDSNILAASTGAIPGSDDSPSASAAATRRVQTEGTERIGNRILASPSPSVTARRISPRIDTQSAPIPEIPEQLFAYSPSLRKRARDETRDGDGVGTSALDPSRPFDDPAESGASPRMGCLDSDGEESDTAGIAKRTRANLSLVDIDFDFIERMMPLPDEGDEGFQFFDDEEEYANFLSAVNLDFEVGDDGEGREDDAAKGTEADDEDDDDDDDDYAAVDPKAARVERRATRHRMMERDGDAPHVTVAGGRTELPEARARRTARRDGPYRYKSKLERPQYRERPVWSTVRTRRMRQAAEAAKAALEAAKKQIASAGEGGMDAPQGGSSAPPGTALLVNPLRPAQLVPYRGDFVPSQVGALHKMISDHVQLLLQTYARSAWDPSPAAQAAARKTLSLINNMLNVTKGRLMAKIRSKEPPHPAECFAKPPAENAGGHKKISSWWPPRPPGSAVYTVLDVAPLRAAQKFVADVQRVGLMAPVPAGLRVPPPAAPPPGAAVRLNPEELKRRHALLESSYGRLSELFREAKDAPTERSCMDDWRADEENAIREFGGDGAKERVRRRPPPNEMVPFYVRLPGGVIEASRALAPFVNPEALPKIPNLRITFSKERWLPSEDSLLATGILNYGISWDAIRRHLLPAKTVKQIMQRQKNLCNSTRFKGKNKVQEAKRRVLQPLSAGEISTIQEVLYRDGAVAGAENWPKICQEFLPGRHASCLDRLWREAHPEGLRVYEPYRRPPSPGGKDAAEPAGVAGAGNGSADVAKPGVAAISMIHASFHDHNASIYAPRRPRVPTSAARENAAFHPSLFAPVTAERSGAAPSAPTHAEPSPPPRSHHSNATSSIPEDADVTLDDVDVPPDPAAEQPSASDVALSRMLFSPSKLPAALRSPTPSPRKPPAAGSDGHHGGVVFEKEEMSDSDEDETRERARARGRPSKAAIAAQIAAEARKQDRPAVEREALVSSDDESDHGGAEREEIESSDSEEEGGAEHSDLEDSDADDEAAAAVAAADARAAPSSIIGSLESTIPPPDASTTPQVGAPTTMAGVAAGIRAAPSTTVVRRREWTIEQDRAILFTAQARGATRDAWDALTAPGGKCRGSTSDEVAARFAWICDRAKRQPCAAPRKAPRRRDAS